MGSATSSDDVSWPLTSIEAKKALEAATELLFEPVFRSTLLEWSKLRLRCKLKAMKRQSLGRIAGKLHAAENTDQVLEVFGVASPEEAFALLQALTFLQQSDTPNLTLMAPYRDEKDHHCRWIATVVKRTLAWAEAQEALFEVDEWLGNRD